MYPSTKQKSWLHLFRCRWASVNPTSQSVHAKLKSKQEVSDAAFPRWWGCRSKLPRKHRPDRRWQQQTVSVVLICLSQISSDRCSTLGLSSSVGYEQARREADKARQNCVSIWTVARRAPMMKDVARYHRTRHALVMSLPYGAQQPKSQRDKCQRTCRLTAHDMQMSRARSVDFQHTKKLRARRKDAQKMSPVVGVSTPSGVIMKSADIANGYYREADHWRKTPRKSPVHEAAADRSAHVDGNSLFSTLPVSINAQSTVPSVILRIFRFPSNENERKDAMNVKDRQNKR